MGKKGQSGSYCAKRNKVWSALVRFGQIKPKWVNLGKKGLDFSIYDQMGLNGENLVKLCQISQYGLIFIVSGLIWIKGLKVGLIRSGWVKLGLLGKKG